MSNPPNKSDLYTINGWTHNTTYYDRFWGALGVGEDEARLEAKIHCLREDLAHAEQLIAEITQDPNFDLSEALERLAESVKDKVLQENLRREWNIPKAFDYEPSFRRKYDDTPFHFKYHSYSNDNTLRISDINAC